MLMWANLPMQVHVIECGAGSSACQARMRAFFVVVTKLY